MVFDVRMLDWIEQIRKQMLDSDNCMTIPNLDVFELSVIIKRSNRKGNSEIRKNI